MGNPNVISNSGHGENLWVGGQHFTKRDGRYVNDLAGGLDDESPESQYLPRGDFACMHGGLRGSRRCLGCGRTINEIELEGG